MAGSRLIILGVAVAAAGGAGYIAKNMASAPPPRAAVQQQPAAPAVELVDVLAVTADVPMGSALAGQIGWQP
ncbi:MAG: Flp pilus assembly protein CpaB, partial [Rhizobiaceae bacterium]|nr:Flp pilus assembly protein CpaB [Rhizobiaceae bacterium]